MLLVIKINQVNSFQWNCSEKWSVCRPLNIVPSLGALVKAFKRLKGGLQSSYFSFLNQNELSTWFSPPNWLYVYGEFVLTPMLLCWNYHFQTSSFNVVSPLDGKKMEQKIHKTDDTNSKMPQQNIWPLLSLLLHPHNG